MTADPKLAKAIFLQAVEQHEPEDWPAFLDQACAAQAELRHRVELLLEAHRQTCTGVHESVDESTWSSAAGYAPEQPGTEIPPYTLLKQLGEGGMGVVYLAEQHEPLRRQVALKIIKPGMDTRQVIARFEAERQALSLVEHPNIARVLDAGATAFGRPYFVMELVQGLPITEYCDQRHLTPRQRLELFLPVCHAIQHAHHKGIIHRDIKPSNILVAEYDQRPVPKVIDFGVAKATSRTPDDKTAFTGLGQIVGTLEYMSPEQAQVNQLDIDTRSDIYSLGVVLYELLTGSTPFDKQRLRSAAWDEMLRIIREDEPPKPSTRLSESKDSLPSISALRHTEPVQLTRLVRGELDWIVMKALEKDRNRRYESANGLAADLQRYLADEAVSACPPSTAYRLRKYARRNKRLLVTVGLFLFLLVATVIGQTIGIVELARERTRTKAANENLQTEQTRTLAALEAEAKRRAQARQALDTLTSQLVEDWVVKQKELTQEHEAFLRQALKYYEEFAADAGQDVPAREAVADAYWRIGSIWFKLAQTEKAEAAWQASHDRYLGLAAEFPGEPKYRARLAYGLGSLADIFKMTGQAQQALLAYTQSTDILRQLAIDAPRDPEYRRDLAVTYSNLGGLLEGMGRRGEAEQAYSTSLDFATQFAEVGADKPEAKWEVARAHHNLAKLAARDGRPQEAERDYRAAEIILAQLVQAYPKTTLYQVDLAILSNNLGLLLKDTGQAAKAGQAFHQAIAIQRQLAADFPVMPEYAGDLARSYNSLGVLLQDAGQLTQAEAAFLQALGLQERLHSEFPKIPLYGRELAVSHENLSNLTTRTNQPDRSEVHGRKALALYEDLHQQFPQVPEYRWDLATCHYQLGIRFASERRWDDAEAEYRLSLEFSQPLVVEFPDQPDFHNHLAGTMLNLGLLYATRKDFAAARRMVEGALPHHLAALQANPRNPAYRFLYWKNRELLSDVLLQLQDHAAAADAITTLAQAVVDPAHDTYNAACRLAKCIALAGADQQLPATRRQELAQEYGDRAMAFVNQAVASGFRDVAHLKQDDDLAPLRARHDFQKLLADLEAKTRPPADGEN